MGPAEGPRHTVASTIEVAWAPAAADAGLWSADVLAGACAWWLDGEHRYWQVLNGLVTVVDVPDA